MKEYWTLALLLQDIWMTKQHIHTLLKFSYNRRRIKQLESIFPKSFILVLNFNMLGKNIP